MSGIDMHIAECRQGLWKFAYKLTHNRADADDLVQAAMERGLERQHQFQNGTNLFSWLSRIVQTVYLDQMRHVDVIRANESAHDPTHHTKPVQLDVVDLRLTQRAIDALSPSFRDILILVAIEGLEYKEASAVLGIPVGTIMSRLARARAALRTSLRTKKPSPEALIQRQKIRATSVNGKQIKTNSIYLNRHIPRPVSARQAERMEVVSRKDVICGRKRLRVVTRRLVIS